MINMDLMGLLDDLLGRLRDVEDNYVPRINLMRNNIEELDSCYIKMKKRKSFWLFFIVILIVWYLTSVLVPFIFKDRLPKLPFLGIVKSFYDTVIPGNKLDLTVPENIWNAISVPVMLLLIIINSIRIPIINLTRKKRAKDWWESDGKLRGLELTRSIEELSAEALNILRQNPLYERFPNCWRNINDCRRIANIVLQRRAFSLEEAFSVYDDILDQEYEKKQELEERRRISENIAALTNELRENERRRERDKIALDAAIDPLLWDLRNK